jgi:hypothetical protein
LVERRASSPAGRARTPVPPLVRRLAIDFLGVRCEDLDGIRFVIASDAEQRGLLRGVLPHLTQFLGFVHHNASRLILLLLGFALVLIPLFLLARLLFLTLAKS